MLWKALAHLILAEVKIAFRNTEAIVFSYGVPALALILFRFFDFDFSLYFSGILFIALLIVAFFGTTDWIVILRTAGILKRFSRYNVSTHNIGFSLFVSRLIIMLLQATMLTFLASALIGSFSLIVSGIILKSVIVAFPLVLLGMLTAGIANQNTVRPICGTVLILGTILSGAFYKPDSFLFDIISRTTGFSTYYHLIANTKMSSLDWKIFLAWTLFLALLTHFSLKNNFRNKEYNACIRDRA